MKAPPLTTHVPWHRFGIYIDDLYYALSFGIRSSLLAVPVDELSIIVICPSYFVDVIDVYEKIGNGNSKIMCFST